MASFWQAQCLTYGVAFGRATRRPSARPDRLLNVRFKMSPLRPQAADRSGTARSAERQVFTSDSKEESSMANEDVDRTVNVLGLHHPETARRAEERAAELLAALSWLTRASSVTGPLGLPAFLISEERMDHARALVAECLDGLSPLEALRQGERV